MNLPDVQRQEVDITLAGSVFTARKLTIGDMFDFNDHKDIIKLLVSVLKDNYPEITEEYIKSLPITGVEDLNNAMKAIGLNNDEKKVEVPAEVQA